MLRDNLNKPFTFNSLGTPKTECIICCKMYKPCNRKFSLCDHADTMCMECC